MQPEEGCEFEDDDVEPPEHLHVSSRWAEKHELEVTAARAARIKKDAEELFRVQLRGFAGPSWDYLEHRLAVYARRVLPRRSARVRSSR